MVFFQWGWYLNQKQKILWILQKKSGDRSEMEDCQNLTQKKELIKRVFWVEVKATEAITFKEDIWLLRLAVVECRMLSLVENGQMWVKTQWNCWFGEIYKKNLTNLKFLVVLHTNEKPFLSIILQSFLPAIGQKVEGKCSGVRKVFRNESFRRNASMIAK